MVVLLFAHTSAFVFSTDTVFTKGLLAVVALLNEKYWSTPQFCACQEWLLVTGTLLLTVVCNIVLLYQSMELICLFLHFVRA